MPNISIQYSSNVDGIDFSALLTRVHGLLVEHCNAKLMACKGTMQGVDAFVIGDGSDPDQAFVIIEIALLSGRTEKQKSRFLNGLKDLVTREIATVLDSRGIKCQVRLKLEEPIRDKQYFFLAN